MVVKQQQKEQSKPQVEKYLTEMKELPGHKEVKREELKAESALLKSVKKVPVGSADIGKSMDVTPEKEERLLTTKEILLVVINIASIALLIVLLIKLPEKANELNELRSQVLLSESEVALEISEVEGHKARAEELKALFIGDQGIVNFVNDIEDLKGENSSISKINITSQGEVKDKTGNYGIPVVIEMRGSWSQFGEDMKKIQQLPYLFRAIRIDSEILDDEGVIGLKYGGFLYVQDKLGENR